MLAEMHGNRDSATRLVAYGANDGLSPVER
jgi:hypothetical protein